MPLLEHAMDPPLCVALRLGCSEEIVSLLLEHGAATCWADSQGLEPLHLLTIGRPPCHALDADVWATLRELEKGYEIRVAAMLLESGASALSRKVMGGADTSSLQIAERVGKTHLVSLFRSSDGLGSAQAA